MLCCMYDWTFVELYRGVLYRRVISLGYVLGRFHNLFWDNCHSHVKNALNRLRYGNFAYWNMGILAAWIFFQGESVISCKVALDLLSLYYTGKFVRFTYSVLPSVILYGVILCLAFLA